MKTVKLCPVALALLLAAGGALPVAAEDMGLIIPMPGKKEIEKASATANIKPKTPTPAKQGKNGSEVFISLPATIKPVKQEPKPAPQQPAAQAAPEKQVIQIELPKPVEKPTTDDKFPAPPDEVTISSGEPIDDMLPPPPPPEVPVSGAVGSDSQTLPVFPKDTSSAIFMVMKTWQAQDYDGATLLKHAIEVYGKEADDAFQIQGLGDGENEEGFKINVEEEDITLDELLDIIAMKSGRDWGVDIPSRTIYFYPKGVKTDNYNVW